MAKFTIILPTYNSKKYIEPCVKSILNQTLSNFELIILDSGSTETNFLEWIKSLNDARIKFYLSDIRLTIEKNWERINNLKKLEYMTIIGHDDILAPDFLHNIEILIEKHPTATLYHTAYHFINEEGKIKRKSKPVEEILNANEFLFSILNKNLEINATGYVMLSKNFDKVGGLPIYPNLLFSDNELWIKLVSLNYLATSNKYSFYFREHQSVSSTSPDYLLHSAMAKFIHFLSGIAKESITINQVIQQNINAYLLTYCKGITHRIIKKPKNDNYQLSVKTVLDDCKKWSLTLNALPPIQFTNSIKMALLISSNSKLHYLFLQFKKLFPAPLFKN